jgi:arylsulfatase A-like enzyme
VVTYTADHGLAVGQHGLMGKQNLYEHSLRVPLIIAGPGVPEGFVSHDLVWHADTNATIRALAGVTADPASEGVALVDQGQVVTPRSGFGAAYAYCQRMYRNERYKLIRYCPTPSRSPTAAEMTPGSDEVQLFDLARDPWEQTNLATEPGYRATRRELEEGLDDWQRAVGDVLLAYHR